MLSGAFRHALQVGKRARAETTIARGTTSLSYAAVEMATSVLGGLEGKQALVIGLGEVGESTARAFASAPGAQPVLVANRTRLKANQVADSLGGRVAPWGDLGAALARADVVACCTAGDGTLLSAALVGEALGPRPGRPMLLVDLAVPRQIDGAVAGLPGVTLLNMDDVGTFISSRVDERRAEVPAVERILVDEFERYSTSLAARSVAPLVSSLHDRAEEIRRAELARFEARLSELSPAQRDALEAMTKRVVAKLLHTPTVTLKAAAGTARGEGLAEAFQDLFGLEP